MEITTDWLGNMQICWMKCYQLWDIDAGGDEAAIFIDNDANPQVSISGFFKKQNWQWNEGLLCYKWHQVFVSHTMRKRCEQGVTL